MAPLASPTLIPHPSPPPYPTPPPRSYPHALYFLDLLQTPEFRAKIAQPAYKELAHTQQFYFWQVGAASAAQPLAGWPPVCPDPPTPGRRRIAALAEIGG